MRSVGVTERRARLAARHRLMPGRRAGDVEAATAAMVGLHATDPVSVYLSARARTEHMSVRDMDRALYLQRSVVKHLAMRRTLFVLPVETLDVVQAGASARVAAAERKRLVRAVEKAGLFRDGEAWLKEACDAVMDALAGGREASWSQLREELPVLAGSISYGEGRTWGGDVPVGPRVLTILSASGLLVRASNAGGWTVSRPRWTLMSSWIGRDLTPPGQREGLAGLVRRWLWAYGPGTEQDLKWWLGSTLAGVRRALQDVGAVEVDLERGPGYLLPDDVEPVAAVEPWAALLPGLDPTAMGWSDREWYLGDHRAHVFDRNGNAGPTAWWDGRIVGGWHQTPAGEIEVEPLEEVDARARQALEAEAGRLTDWLAGVRVSHRFPSPLMRARTRTRGTTLRP